MINKKYFGTDGIRGKANKYPMTAEIALKVGMAAGSIFISKRQSRVVIGKDTRLSGYMIENALTAGFLAVGMNVILVGPIPTPAIAMLTKSLRADLGIMISASHNPFSDNGIKIFDTQGYKISDKHELEIERIIEDDDRSFLANAENIGRAKRLDDALGRYIEYVKNTFPKGKRLDNLKIVIDTANGAAYHLAPSILWELGAEVIAIGDKPNGTNINVNCGVMDPTALQSAVMEHNADIGIAFDGDADRLIICDEKGNIVDGDEIIATIATDWHKHNRLHNQKIVTTTMSNLGLEKYLKTLDLQLIRTNIGDRHVMQSMQKHGSNLGGEQSGHIILSDYSTTGDAIIATLQILSILMRADKPASEVLHPFTLYPQILKNILYNNKDILEQEAVKQAIKQAHTELGNTGRILIRKSGTEPLIRIMIEGTDKQQIHKIVTTLADTMKVHA